jgi:hypothetical protein
MSGIGFLSNFSILQRRVRTTWPRFSPSLGKCACRQANGTRSRRHLRPFSKLSPSQLPVIPGTAAPPEGWRRIAALHRELSRRSANGIYFLTCRHAAKAAPGLSHQAAYNINLALAQLGVVDIVQRGDARPIGGRASQFRYLMSQTENVVQQANEGDVEI